MNIKYEDRKCSCCGLVHENSLLMEKTNQEVGQFIICYLCAESVYKYILRMKDNVKGIK